MAVLGVLLAGCVVENVGDNSNVSTTNSAISAAFHDGIGMEGDRKEASRGKRKSFKFCAPSGRC